MTSNWSERTKKKSNFYVTSATICEKVPTFQSLSLVNESNFVNFKTMKKSEFHVLHIVIDLRNFNASLCIKDNNFVGSLLLLD